MVISEPLPPVHSEDLLCRPPVDSFSLLPFRCGFCYLQSGTIIEPGRYQLDHGVATLSFTHGFLVFLLTPVASVVCS